MSELLRFIIVFLALNFGHTKSFAPLVLSCDQQSDDMSALGILQNLLLTRDTATLRRVVSLIRGERT